MPLVSREVLVASLLYLQELSEERIKEREFYIQKWKESPTEEWRSELDRITTQVIHLSSFVQELAGEIELYDKKRK